MDARGEERPLCEEREAHRGGEFLGISDTEVRLHTPHAGGAARDDERGGDAKRFERV